MLKMRFLFAVLTFMIFAACAQAQVPAQLDDLKPSDWEAQPDPIELITNSEADSVISLNAGAALYGTVDEQRVLWCNDPDVGWFTLAALRDSAWAMVTGARAFGDNAPTARMATCVQLIAKEHANAQQAGGVAAFRAPEPAMLMAAGVVPAVPPLRAAEGRYVARPARLYGDDYELMPRPPVTFGIKMP